MAVEIYNINVGSGDCLLICADNLSIMIDCGKYNKNVKAILKEKKIEKLDLVIATHIDNDHVSGLCELLKTMPVDNILFNGFHHIPLEWSVNASKDISDEIYNQLRDYSSYFNTNQYLETKINAEESLFLSKVIRSKNIAWNKITDEERLSVDNKIDIKFKEIQIHLLSPNDELLKNTYQQYRKFIYDKTGQLLSKDKLEDLTHSLYDLALKDDVDNSEEYHINAVLPLSKKLVQKYARELQQTDKSPSNGASLAFILEVEEKRILMLGDSFPDVVADNLRNINNGAVNYFDAIKISHHGSSKNTTTELLNLIDSPIYIFSGGNQTDKPSEYTISKIVTREIPFENFTKRNLYFNRDSNNNIKLFQCYNDFHNEISFTIITNQTAILL